MRTHSFRPNLPFVTPITCPQCGGKAHLAKLAPAASSFGGELRYFECAECGHITKMTNEPE